MTNPLLDLLDDRDADGEKKPAGASWYSGDPTTTTDTQLRGGFQTNPRVAAEYWSDPAPALAFDNTRTKTEQARSATGYQEILQTLLFDGVDQYGYPANVLTRIY